MTYELTNEEKIGIINGRLKMLELSRYDSELAVQEENAIASPNQQILDDHQSRLIAIAAKKAVLQVELEELS